MDNRFTIQDNNDGTYRIECLFIVYRQKFGHHPTFLPQDEEKGRLYGFSTKFYFLVEDDMTKQEAVRKIKDYDANYNKLIDEIENDDTRWDEFPFKNNTVIYSK